jgi:hypothetical protein
LLALGLLAGCPALLAVPFMVDFDHAYFLNSDVTGGFTDFSSDVTAVNAVNSNISMSRMALWDTDDVTWDQRNFDHKADYNDLVSEIEWNNGDIDGISGATTPNYKGVKVGDFWKGLGITVTQSSGTIALMDSFDPFLNDGVAGDSGNVKNGAGVTSSKADGDPDNLTGKDPAVVAKKKDATAPNNGKPGQPILGMGNLLIFEETPGDAIPDDTGNGGIIRFEIDDENLYTGISVEARLSQFLFVDDTRGKISLTFVDGTTLTSTSHTTLSGLNYAGTIENEIFFVDIKGLLEDYDAATGNDYANTNLDYWSVDFDSSGGLGEVQFEFLNTAPPAVPETSTLAGASVAFGLAGASFLIKRKRKKQQPAATAGS